MRTYLLVSAAALFALTASGFADSVVTAGTTVNGTIALKCTLSTTTTTLDIGDISTDGTGKHLGGLHNTTPILAGTAMCNGTGNTVDLKATPLTTGATATGFTNVVDYTLVVGSLLPGSITLDTPSPTNTNYNHTGVGAFANTDATGATFITKATALPVMAGTYSGTVNVTLTAGF